MDRAGQNAILLPYSATVFAKVTYAKLQHASKSNCITGPDTVSVSFRVLKETHQY
jgi:hypothetical protein